ncbi:hypothetical protein [Actinokineospora sp. NBRC 105648]|uniref:hypothetical protein n=1 Tax=Actinokineospora sp. NBRC 105648 TaxID=3032206 RepID=UPI0024A3569A|nr:hypothetical protein [Actinokineospora sp. NBRC 105648]GLZ40689.1 hypothetical protein Acsp05_43130 [Actinokineospora sp. NBRC 105648]
MALTGRLRSAVRRTAGRFTLFAVVAAVLAVAVAVFGWLAVDYRQDRLTDAVDRQGELTTAALDAYRAMADADASSLNAVIVGPERAVVLRQRFRQDVFAAADALRVAAVRSQDAGSVATTQIRELTGLLPEYARLVETGWTNSDARHPVGTSYLANASYLVRTKLLPMAGELHTQQTEALIKAQQDAGSTPWFPLVLGIAALVVLVVVQRDVTRRTRRRVNYGLAAATALTLVVVVSLAVVVQVVSAKGSDSERELHDVVAPLARARNLGRESDGAEARILIFPKVGDIGELVRNLDEIEALVARAGAEPDRTEAALSALRAWRAHDQGLFEQAAPNPQTKPLLFTEVAAVITDPPPGESRTDAQRLDDALNTLIESHTAAAGDSTRSAKRTLANWDGVVLLLMFGAAVAAVLGLRPRIREYQK